MVSDEFLIQRCFDLARLGAGSVSPNPLVGALLFHNNQIIGEGWHQKYGQAHAEVNAVASVPPNLRYLIPKATIYVSLEPCSIFGKTPPCTDLILRNKIPKVVISYIDHTPGVDGKGIRMLREHDVEVVENILPEKGKAFSRIRNTFVRHQRPYVILKFARTYNGFFGKKDRSQFWITDPITKRLTHKWRTEFDAIMVGRKTVEYDNPQLTSRLFPGKSPLRIILDPHRRLSTNSNIFDGKAPTLLVLKEGEEPYPERNNLSHLFLKKEQEIIPYILHCLAQMNITSVMVEGGAQLINSFIKQNLWDEARVLVGDSFLAEGIPAPIIPVAPRLDQKISLNDRLLFYKNLNIP